MNLNYETQTGFTETQQSPIYTHFFFAVTWFEGGETEK